MSNAFQGFDSPNIPSEAKIIKPTKINGNRPRPYMTSDDKGCLKGMVILFIIVLIFTMLIKNGCAS